MIKSKVFLILFLILFINSVYLISSQNETNITAFCGDGITQQELGEECDEGNNNGVSCSALYGEDCNYCDASCKNAVFSGAYCGDKICQTEKEDYQNCPKDNCQIPPKNECNFDTDCKEKPTDNLCTENKCVGDPKKCISANIDYKRVDNDKYYCLEGNLENQKNEGDSCNENAECKSNVCTEGKCLKIKKGFLQTIFESLGLSALYDKLKAWGFF